MNDEMLTTAGFFFTVIVLGLGIPIVRSWVRRKEREPVVGPGDAERDARLARIEHAVETMAIEVERISEGQRYVTRLIASRAEEAAAALPQDTAR